MDAAGSSEKFVTPKTLHSIITEATTTQVTKSGSRFQLSLLLQYHLVDLMRNYLLHIFDSPLLDLCEVTLKSAPPALIQFVTRLLKSDCMYFTDKNKRCPKENTTLFS
jgi:hypothetical protein